MKKEAISKLAKEMELCMKEHIKKHRWQPIRKKDIGRALQKCLINSLWQENAGVIFSIEEERIGANNIKHELVGKCRYNNGTLEVCIRQEFKNDGTIENVWSDYDDVLLKSELGKCPNCGKLLSLAKFKEVLEDLISVSDRSTQHD